MTDRIVIVGASLAGSRTVKLLRRYGFEGEIVLVGDEPHLPYDRPPLSKRLLAGSMEPDAVTLEDEAFYEGVELRLGRRAVALDVDAARVVLDDDTTVSGDHVVVATGATPRRLPDQPDLPGIHLLRTLDDALTLRDELTDGSRVVIVGAGFIGMEVAATATERGCQVSVVEFLDTPLVRGLGPELGATVADVHRERGVRFHLGRAVETFAGDERVTAVVLDDGTRLEADVVVVGIGVEPSTEWLEGSGLTLENGVVCDDRLRAVGGRGRVWAVGDVARWPSARYDGLLRVEHWTNATETAQVVAKNLTGQDAVHDPIPYVWSDQYDLKIQSLGRVTAEDELEVVLGSVEELRFVAIATRGGAVRGAVGVRWPRALMRFRMLIDEGADIHAARTLGTELNGTSRPRSSVDAQ